MTIESFGTLFRTVCIGELIFDYSQACLYRARPVHPASSYPGGAVFRRGQLDSEFRSRAMRNTI
jgi:hypothetical protein